MDSDTRIIDGRLVRFRDGGNVTFWSPQQSGLNPVRQISLSEQLITMDLYLRKIKKDELGYESKMPKFTMGRAVERSERVFALSDLLYRRARGGISFSNLQRKALRRLGRQERAGLKDYINEIELFKDGLYRECRAVLFYDYFRKAPRTNSRRKNNADQVKDRSYYFIKGMKL